MLVRAIAKFGLFLRLAHRWREEVSPDPDPGLQSAMAVPSAV
jgi:hypothetical protein